jgi:hypothetical protein
MHHIIHLMKLLLTGYIFINSTQHKFRFRIIEIFSSVKLRDQFLEKKLFKIP